MYKLFCDLETTGLDKIGCDILTGTILVTDIDNNVQEEINFYSKPESKKYWNEDAEAIHKLTWDFCQKFPSNKAAAGYLIYKLNKYKSHTKDLPFIYHANGKFDYWFMENLFRRTDLIFEWWDITQSKYCISTIDLAKQYRLNNPVEFKSNSLDNWCKHFNIPLDHHNSKSDTYACYELYKNLTTEKEFTLSQ